MYVDLMSAVTAQKLIMKNRILTIKCFLGHSVPCVKGYAPGKEL